jgi:hypothetical protein
MKFKHGFIAIACSLFMFTAQADEYLSGDEIRKTVSGKTGIGQHLKKDRGVRSYFAGDGAYTSVLSHGSTRKGTWWVDDRLLCLRIHGETKDRCRGVRADGAGGYELVNRNKDLPVEHYERFEDGDQT